MIFRLFFCSLLIASAFCAQVQAKSMTTLPPSGSNCETALTCEAECSSGIQASCVREAQAHRDGFGVIASKAKAAAILKKSCDDHQYPRACMEYGWIVREGWMFEVERDADVFQEYGVSRARRYAILNCPNGKIVDVVDLDACLVRAELEKRLIDLGGWPDIKGGVSEVAKKVAQLQRRIDLGLELAQQTCKRGHSGACQWLLDEVPDIEDHGFTNKADAIEGEARAGFVVGCKKGDNRGCAGVFSLLLSGTMKSDEEFAKSAPTYAASACRDGNVDSCFVVQVLRPEFLRRVGEPSRKEVTQQTKSQEILSLLLGHCEAAKSPFVMEACDEVAKLYIDGTSADFFGSLEPKEAVKMYRKRCQNGFLESCNTLAKLAKGRTDGRLRPVPELALEASRKVCSLSPFEEACELCSTSKEGRESRSPKDAICRTRLAWNERVDCDEGKEQRCEVLATMYEETDGVGASPPLAARYYRLACDAALKSSCSKLEELCSSEEELGDNQSCNQSLIHTDVFYEAEWQFRQSGSAKVVSEETSPKRGSPQLAVSAEASSGGSLSLKRGTLDSELVVSIVLDRARQAAIRLVVRELKRVSGKDSVPTYLEDLMIQASLLLSDQESMRREKFQDLAMTVVRSFVATNLTKTLFETNQAILDAQLWKVWAAESKLRWNPSEWHKSEVKKLRSYISNWVYYGLSETKLFARPGEMAPPSCPFRKDASKVMCQLLEAGKDKTTGVSLPAKARLSALLQIDAVLDGLSLAKALREQGLIDLRRLIEAIGHSRTIADFRQTPGLNMQQWKRDIDYASETKLRVMEERLLAAQIIFTKRGWEEWVSSYEGLHSIRMHALQLVGEGSPYLAIFDSKNVQKARIVLRLAEDVERQYQKIDGLKEKLAELGGFRFAENSSISAATVSAEITLANLELIEIEEFVLQAIANWSDSAVFLSKFRELRGKMKTLQAPLVTFRRSLVEIETILSRYKPPRKPGSDITIDVQASFKVADVPLYALPELIDQLKSVARNLKEIDSLLGPIFPGAARPKIKFAISAVVRLLGFLDMMERVARTARLNQTCGEVMDALRLLGTVRNNEFSAPLFDVMDPILHAIKTHDPMDVDLLFTILSEVRLDSLLSSLADNAEKPCAENDEGYECWTFKIIHSLQESVKRTGDSIHLDGGEFAKRLASHGDDFRRKHKWRGYFHLTVGLGGLYSRVPDVMRSDSASSNRTVPLVGEQIGFGWASPTFWDDSFTFKTGVYGSGILYRAALDSAESNAIMVSPFIALDVFDLVELYAGPMALFYPPSDGKDSALEWGAAAGITVPLSSYLDKL